jgi:hypothetical protein
VKIRKKALSAYFSAVTMVTHVHMILTDRSINQLHLLHLAKLLQNIYDVLPYLPVHYLPLIFRDKNYMVRAIPMRMLYTLIIHMDTSLLNSNGLRNLYYSNMGGFILGLWATLPLALVPQRRWGIYMIGSLIYPYQSQLLINATSSGAEIVIP